MAELRQRPAGPVDDTGSEDVDEKDELSAVKTLLHKYFTKKFNNKHIRRRAILYLSSGSMFVVYLLYSMIIALLNQPTETVPAYINTKPYKPQFFVRSSSQNGVMFDGAGGKGYYLKRHKLDKGRSDALPLNRPLEDFRPVPCKVKQYVKTKLRVSIVIVLDIAPPSVVLRMIVSAVTRTRPENLAEIVVMAPKGSLELSSYLWEYGVSDHVKIVPIPHKASLNSYRNDAATHASGDVLVFLPEAVEILPGWAEPLLEAMATTENGLLAGLSMDGINGETFEQIEHVPWHLISLPRWEFTSAVPMEIPEHEVLRRERSPYPGASPVQTPVLQFIPWAADRATFLRMGGLDDGLSGSSNQVPGDIIELSIRWWACGGGEVAYIPCSKVAVVSLVEDTGAQEVSLKEATLHNSLRIARRWPGSHKSYFYEAVPEARTRQGTQSVKLDDTISRLSCQNLDWFIDNIAVDWMFGSKVLRRGVIQAYNSNACVDHMGHDGRYSPGRPRFYNCHGQHSQTWVHVASNNQIQTETGKCLMSDQYWHDVITLDYCREGHTWKWEPVSQGSRYGYLVYKDLCLEHRPDNNFLFFVKCDQSSAQTFTFEKLS